MRLLCLLSLFTLILAPACSGESKAEPTPTKPTIGYGMAIEAGLDFPRALAMTKDAGFEWVKIQVRWENQEAQKGKIDWNLVDTAVEETSKRNMKLLLSVVTAPKWARPQNTDFSVPGPSPAGIRGRCTPTKSGTSRTCGTSGAARISA